MKKHLYIFSGLGADERVFQKLDFSEFDATHIKWIVPQGKETIEEYAQKLLEQIKTPKPVLLGLSFGGIMATEVGKLIETEKIILISSAKTKYEIPLYFRIIGKTRLHNIIPAYLLKKTNFISDWFFGVESEWEKKLLAQILNDTDSVFLKWAIDKIVNWENIVPPKNSFHIHGTNDKLLPYRYVHSDISIKNGGHFMVLNKAVELNSLLVKTNNLPTRYQ